MRGILRIFRRLLAVSAFCGIAFRAFLVLQAPFAEIRREHPAIARACKQLRKHLKSDLQGPVLLRNHPRFWMALLGVTHRTGQIFCCLQGAAVPKCCHFLEKAKIIYLATLQKKLVVSISHQTQHEKFSNNFGEISLRFSARNSARTKNIKKKSGTFRSARFEISDLKNQQKSAKSCNTNQRIDRRNVPPLLKGGKQHPQNFGPSKRTTPVAKGRFGPFKSPT